MKKILIIEDDSKISMALGVRLRANGYEVVSAFDAMVGLSQVVKQQPDLVILDVSMPAGNGFSVAERIRFLAPSSGTPIIFITASKDPTFKSKAAALGAAGFHEKPFDFSKILATVQQSVG